MQVRLVTHYTDGTIESDRTFEGPDLNSVLWFALNNWRYARANYRDADGGLILNDRLHVGIDGAALVPVRDALAAAAMQEAA